MFDLSCAILAPPQRWWLALASGGKAVIVLSCAFVISRAPGSSWTASSGEEIDLSQDQLGVSGTAARKTCTAATRRCGSKLSWGLTPFNALPATRSYAQFDSGYSPECPSGGCRRPEFERPFHQPRRRCKTRRCGRHENQQVKVMAGRRCLQRLWLTGFSRSRISQAVCATSDDH